MFLLSLCPNLVFSCYPNVHRPFLGLSCLAGNLAMFVLAAVIYVLLDAQRVSLGIVSGT